MLPASTVPAIMGKTSTIMGTLMLMATPMAFITAILTTTQQPRMTSLNPRHMTQITAVFATGS
ncbi:MAG: hypothetical protein JNM43_02020 [Planctomycetaceae bacterium]|nr:hypothetical protein [Planctomycetaceae bacterium]